MINRNYLDIISHRKKGKASFTRLCALLTLLCFIPFQCVYGLPSGEQVESGTVSFERSDTSLKITASDNAIINFNSFNIGLGETVTFLQPETTSKVLNRISGPGASVIEGSLLSNGIVFLVNPSGLHFASTATVNVGSLVASTLNIESRDFLQGNYIFSNTATPGTIINEGTLTANQGGSIAMLSHHIENSGLIQAHLGKIVIASGDALTLSFDNNHLLCFVIDTPTQKALEGIDTAIANSGTLDAQGGNVYIEAQAVKDVFKASINNSGIIKANSVKEHNGTITLVASGATINSGTIDTSSIQEGVNGGDIALHSDTIVQKGTIKANAEDNSKAGYIELLGKTKSTYTNGALIEAKGKDTLSEGGKVYINTTEGDTDYQKGALIDVSGGTVSGDAGSIEISAKDQLGYQGKVRGVAQAGYKGGSVFFDPFNINIDNIGGGAVTSPGNWIKEAFGDHPGFTMTFNPQAGGAFLGFSNIALQATNDININSNFNTDIATGHTGVQLQLYANHDININANITTNNAPIELDASNNINQAAGTTINAGTSYIYVDAGTGGSGTVNRAPTSSMIAGNSVSYWTSADTNTSSLLTSGDDTSGGLWIYANNGHSLTVDAGITRQQGIYLYATNITQSAGTSISSAANGIGINPTGVFTQNAGATMTANGSIAINTAGTGSILNATANGAGHNVTINATGGGGMLTVGALTASGDIAFTNTGNFVIADDGFAGTMLTGNLITLNGQSIGTAGNNISTQANSLAITTSNGSAYIREQDTATINASTTTNGNVYISSATPISLAGLLNASGIGSDILDFTVRSGDYNIASLANLDGVSFNFTATAGNVNVTGPLNAARNISLTGNAVSINNTIATGTANITATANTGDINVNNSINGNVITLTSTNGNILNTAGTVSGLIITLNGKSVGTAGNNISTQATTLAINATNGSAYVREQDTATINASTITNGSAYISSATPIALAGALTATGAGNNTVNLTVRSGDYNIADLTNLNGQEGFNFTATAGNVNVTGALTTANRDLSLTGNAVSINNTVTTGTANTTITANTGNINLNSLITGKNITLTSTTGNILDGNGAANNITSTGACNFTAGGYIATAIDPLEVTINPGSLSVTVHGQNGGVSSAISGTILPDNRYSYNADAPGSIFFGGTDIKAADAAAVQAAADAAARQAYIDSITLHEKDNSLYYDMGDKKDTVQQQGTTSATSGIGVPNIVDFSSYTLPNPYNFHISPYLVIPEQRGIK